MSVFEFIIRRKTFVAMLFTGLTLLGYISYRQLSVELMPDVELPFLIVSVTAPREMNPEYFERQAVIPLEGAVGTLEGVSKLETYIQQRRATITVYYDQNVNTSLAYIKLQEKIGEIAPSLDEDFNVQAQKIDTERFSNMFMGLQVRGSGGLDRIRAIIDRSILDRIQNIDGIANVEVIGGQAKSVEIVLNEQISEAHAITPARVRTLISRNTARKEFVGHVHGEGAQTVVNVVADYTDIRDLENIVVDTRGPVLLRDIADVYFGESEQESISRVNGKDAVTLQVVRDANVNLIELSHTTRAVIDRLNRELAPQDVEIVIQSDSSEEMERNIDLIIDLALSGALLAVLILWYFLKNLRVVIIIVLAIPVSVLVSMNIFYLYGITLNSLTLLGIALAVGMLLDNSVVVLENIYRHMSLSGDTDRAVVSGTREVWRSIVAATLTTVTVFLPFVFSSNYLIRVIGRHIGISIIATLLVSLVVALVLVPAAAHRLLSRRDVGKGLIVEVTGTYRPIRIYTLLLKSAVRFPARTVVAAVVLFFVSLLICLGLSLDVSRELDLTSFNLYVIMPKGSTLERTDSVVADLESELGTIEEIKDIISTIYEEEGAITVVLTDDYEDISGRSIAQIKSDIENRVDNFSAADVSLSEPRSSRRFGGGGGMNPVANFERMFGIGAQQEKVVIRGNDFELISKVADDVEFYLGELDTIRRTNLSIGGNRPEVHVFFDRLLMSRNGITLAAVSTELGSFQNQLTTGLRYKQGVDEYDIVIRSEEVEEDKTFEDLQALRIENSAGAEYEMESIGDIVFGQGISGINRVNQEKVVDVVFSFQPEVNDSKAYLEASRAEVDDLIASISIPPGVALEVVHDESELEEFYFLIGAALLFIFMILASVFESLWTPLVMMFTIPLATVGSLWALILTGNSLMNANALMGFLILLGVVVNNGILLIDYTRILRQRGFRRTRAIMTAGRARLRPILITAITTIAAMIPLAMGKAEYVSRIGAPFAITVIGGLTAGTIFTLVFIPTVYSGLESALDWMRGLGWGARIVQLAAFAAACYLIYWYVGGPIWIGATLFLAVTGIPALAWFTMSSLRRAQERFIEPDASITINIRRAVKIYDGPGRFAREWKISERYERLFGSKGAYSVRRLLELYAWQFPLLAFIVFFVYFYLDHGVWLVLLSVGVYFFVLSMTSPLADCLADLSRKKNTRLFGVIGSLVHGAVFWGFPVFSAVVFHEKDIRPGAIAFTAAAWYTALAVYTISNRLHRKNINIMRLTGRLAGVRRLIYRFVLFIPVIGRKKKPFNALDGVTLDIGSGMFGLLGPNGAGKTTIMRIICGIYEKTLGTIRFNDIDFTENREELQGLIGYLPQEFGTYENMTAFEFLDYIAILKGIVDTGERERRVNYVLESVHLADNKNRKIGSFSGGMKQRMGIAMTLLHLPRVLVVDEPTAGLDPRERIRFRNLLVELSRERVIIFSTHIIEDISSSCNKVAVLNRGILQYLGAPVNMTDAAGGNVWQFILDPADFERLRRDLRIVHHMRVDEGIRVRCLSDTEPWPGAEQVRPTLEDAYLWLIGTPPETTASAAAE